MLASLADSSISDGEHIVVVLVIGPGAYVSGVMETVSCRLQTT